MKGKKKKALLRLQTIKNQLTTSSKKLNCWPLKKDSANLNSATVIRNLRYSIYIFCSALNLMVIMRISK